MNVRSTHTRRHRGGNGVGGFTLTEMLIVMGIIVVVALVAVPSFRALTGGRSTEAASNMISAALARARLDAVGLQEPRGILFYRDLDTQRVGMVEVRGVSDAVTCPIEIASDRDTLLLPAGVGIQFIDNATNATDDNYIGFNTARRAAGANAAYPDTIVPYGGLILFDRRGQLKAGTWDFWMGTPGGKSSELARFLHNDPSYPAPPAPPPPPALPPPTIDPQPETKIGFVLFDEDAFNSANAHSVAANGDPDPQVSGTGVAGPFSPDEQGEERWLDENGQPFLVNRYNGTLVRSQ